MDVRNLIDFYQVLDRMKCNVRHSWTSSGDRECVAAHCFSTAMLALLISDEFKDLDMNRVVKMCLFHDMGEALTGDVPTFLKGKQDEEKEAEAVEQILSLLSESLREEYSLLFVEMEGQKTPEAKLFKALDKMDAVMQHNEAPIETWLSLEYQLQLEYGAEEAKAFPFTEKLREEINRDVKDKIEKEGGQDTAP